MWTLSFYRRNEPLLSFNIVIYILLSLINLNPLSSKYIFYQDTHVKVAINYALDVCIYTLMK